MKKNSFIIPLKIATNIFLAIMLLITVITIINYKEEVREVIGGKDPDRLIQKYEELTETKCLCANPGYGDVIYVPRYNNNLLPE